MVNGKLYLICGFYLYKWYDSCVCQALNDVIKNFFLLRDKNNLSFGSMDCSLNY
jgi:hypothetical protein